MRSAGVVLAAIVATVVWWWLRAWQRFRSAEDEMDRAIALRMYASEE